MKNELCEKMWKNSHVNHVVIQYEVFLDRVLRGGQPECTFMLLLSIFIST